MREKEPLWVRISGTIILLFIVFFPLVFAFEIGRIYGVGQCQALQEGKH